MVRTVVWSVVHSLSPWFGIGAGVPKRTVSELVTSQDLPAALGEHEVDAVLGLRFADVVVAVAAGEGLVDR